MEVKVELEEAGSEKVKLIKSSLSTSEIILSRFIENHQLFEFIEVFTIYQNASMKESQFSLKEN